LEILQKNVVAFIDLLGFKEAVKQASKNNVDVEKILDLLEKIKEGENPISQMNTEVTQREKLAKLRPAITASSDSLVISFPEYHLDQDFGWRHVLIEMANIIGQLFKITIEAGFLFRGGISFECFYHKNGVFFGQALEEALEVESNIAVYPRVIVDPQLIKKVEDESNGGTWVSFFKDSDSLYCLDYLSFMRKFTGFMETTLPEKISELMEKNIAELEKAGKLNELAKWQYFKKYYNRTILSYLLEQYELPN